MDEAAAKQQILDEIMQFAADRMGKGLKAKYAPAGPTTADGHAGDDLHPAELMTADAAPTDHTTGSSELGADTGLEAGVSDDELSEEELNMLLSTAGA